MRIKKKISQHRRDFHALYECEHCNSTMERYGYDDANFHDNVIPNWPCPECKKTSDGKSSSSADVSTGVIL